MGWGSWGTVASYAFSFQACLVGKILQKKKNPKDTLVSLRTVASAEPSLLFLDQPALRVHRTGAQLPEVTVPFLRAINKGRATPVIKGNLNFLPSFLCAVKNSTDAIFPETAW